MSNYGGFKVEYHVMAYEITLLQAYDFLQSLGWVRS